MLLQVPSWTWEGLVSSSSPADIASGEDVDKKSLALLVSTKPGLTEHEVRAKGKCVRERLQRHKSKQPSLEVSVPLFSKCLQT